MQEKKSTILRKLFFSTLYLSAFTFGGGYVIVTLLKNKFVDQYHWIDEEEMLDLVAIAQSSPGAIAVNGAAPPPATRAPTAASGPHRAALPRRHRRTRSYRRRVQAWRNSGSSGFCAWGHYPSDAHTVCHFLYL